MSADRTRTHKVQATLQDVERGRWIAALLRRIADELADGQIDSNLRLSEAERDGGGTGSA